MKEYHNLSNISTQIQYQEIQENLEYLQNVNND